MGHILLVASGTVPLENGVVHVDDVHMLHKCGGLSDLWEVESSS